MTDLAALTRATAALDPPLAALDLAAARANLADLARRSGGTPVRVASKSVRCRYVLDLALSTPGFAGVMAYSLREALWLVASGVRDVLMGYPTADRGALAVLGADPVALESITLMVDDPGHLADVAARCPGLPRCRRVAAHRPAAPRRAPLAAAHAAGRGDAGPHRCRARACGSSASCSTRRRSPGCPTRRRPCGWSRSARQPSSPRGAARSSPRCRTPSARCRSSTPAGRAASRSVRPIRSSPR